MSRQVDKKKTMQVRIDAGVHRLLKIKAAKTRETLRGLIEGALTEVLAIDKDNCQCDVCNIQDEEGGE